MYSRNLTYQPGRTARRSLLLLALCSAGASSAVAQTDPLQEWNRSLLKETNNILGFSFEQRTRWEDRHGVNFGRSVNQQDMLSRVRLGLQFKPYSWLKISAMAQDARVPFFGVPAPNTLRDTLDLQEANIQLFPDRKNGFGATFGRQMLGYGETRVIGGPQWAPLARTFDAAHVYYQTANRRFEVLLISPVKIRTDSFNVPNLGERIWGTYNVFSKIFRGASIDAYALRHSQNRIGGWLDAGTLGTNTVGGRFYGPLPARFSYSLEAIGQTGHIGALRQRAFAGSAAVSRKVSFFDRPMNLTLEYKVASGTRQGSTNSGTYDQLSPANHDKFGHIDLFGWRNLKTFRGIVVSEVTKRLTVNLMYTDARLYSATDALYTIQGSVFSVSQGGTAGTHLGQEFDIYASYSRGAHTFGAGIGHFFKGEFVSQTTPNVTPRYLYVYQQYSFK
ncbi:MAG: alginate export family protein [Bryobacteraceae bacterium]